MKTKTEAYIAFWGSMACSFGAKTNEMAGLLLIVAAFSIFAYIVLPRDKQ